MDHNEHSKKLHIDSLVIECTRRCNMQCAHCLRGDAELVDANIGDIATLFRKIDSVGCLTLSGGEPSIVPHIMRMVREEAFVANVDVQSFYIATNGKDVPDEFVYEVVRWYGQCTDNEISQVKISRDNYHDELFEVNPMLTLLKLTEVDEFRYTDEALISEGNAALNLVAFRVLDDEHFEVEVEGDDIRIVEGDLYMNVHGDIIGGCDWSYTSQEEHVIGNISELDLREWAVKESENNEN